MGPMGLAVAIVLAVAMNALSYFHSDRIVLRMHQAQQMSRDDYPGLIAIAEELSVKAGIPTPKLYSSRQLSIPFATTVAIQQVTRAGGNHSEGLIQLLSVRELRALLLTRLGTSAIGISCWQRSCHDHFSDHLYRELLFNSLLSLVVQRNPTTRLTRQYLRC